MSYFIKKNLLLYKNLVKYLASRQNLSVKKSGSVNKCIKFEIKLYLLALSFNRFIFNFDKILFMLCIITNFLYFLSFQHPRVLFFGEYTTTFECMFKKAARDCNQIYYSKCLLPGSITNIEPIDFYYERFGNNIFTKNLDCVLTFFSNPVSQELKEITTLGIPIIGLVEINAINLFGITHPIVCTRSISSVYFFSNYFSKLLNTNTELYNSPKIRYRRNGIRLLSSFSSSAKTQVQGLEFSKLITDDIFFINRLIFFLGISKPLFLRNTFLLKKPRNSECFVEFKNRFVDFLNYLFLYIRFTTKFIPG